MHSRLGFFVHSHAQLSSLGASGLDLDGLRMVCPDEYTDRDCHRGNCSETVTFLHAHSRVFRTSTRSKWRSRHCTSIPDPKDSITTTRKEMAYVLRLITMGIR